MLVDNGDGTFSIKPSYSFDKQEPVAWRNLCVSNIGEDSEWIYNEIGQGEPLYTTPRELSDEEILEVSHTVPYANRFEFARAILKKASEK